MEIILVRHGESTFNEMNRRSKRGHLYTGQYDVPLTKKGEQQALNLLTHPFIKKLDAVYASDLCRTMETAKLATGQEDIVVDQRIRERSLGVFEGKYEDELRLSYPTFDFDQKFNHSFSLKAIDGENYQEVSLRVKSFLNSLDYSMNRIAIFSHFVTIRLILLNLLNLEESDILNYQIPNCQPIVLTGELFPDPNFKQLSPVSL